MGKRIRLGLIFSVDENWIGGTYYILNLLSALGTLPVEKQPFITILSKNKTDLKAAQLTGYPFLDHHNPFHYKRNLVEAAINKLMFLFTKRNFIDKRISPVKIDILFPASKDPCFDRIEKKVYWFPDFQHIIYPDFFSALELRARNDVVNQIASAPNHLVLSSQAARRDWESLKLLNNTAVHVIPFAVTHPPIADIEIKGLLKEFGIERNYFIISNQFWKHKNHLVVLKAALKLKKQGSSWQFVFTGKEDDYRNPGYFKTIKSFIEENDLNDTVKMLGLIDRRKQLRLMQHAKAVVQPSLFEGWSTVIEDAKSLGKYVIASDIPVHREQLASEECFFEAHNEDALVEKIKSVLSLPSPALRIDYQKNIQVFGKQFFDMLETIN